MGAVITLIGHIEKRRDVGQGRPAAEILEETAGFHCYSTIARDYRADDSVRIIEVPTDRELARNLEPEAVSGMHPGIAPIARK